MVMKVSDSGTHRPIALGKLERSASAVAGIAGLGVGGWATMNSTNQAGSAAILLLGALFLLMAVSGRVPDRISKDGIDYRAVVNETAIEDLKDSESPIVTDAVAEALTRAKEEVSERILPPSRDETSHQTFFRLERQVLGTLADGDWNFEDRRDAHSIGVDAIVERGSRKIGIDVKYSRQPKVNIAHLLRHTPRVLAEGLDHIVVVVIRPKGVREHRLPAKAGDVLDGVTFVQVEDDGHGKLGADALHSVRDAVSGALA